MKRYRKLLLLLGFACLAVIAAFYGFSTLNRARADFDPTHLAAVVRGKIARSVVATGKIEPLTKVEIKSKANGIIKALDVDVGDTVKPGDILAELDKENLLARAREARANLQATEAALEVALAELKKNAI